MSDEPILSDDDITKIGAGLRASLGDSIEQPQIYRLGRFLSDGTPQIKVPGEAGQAWIRSLGEGAGDPIPAINTGLSEEQLIFGSYVEVVPYNNSLRIVGRAPEDTQYAGDVPTRSQRPISLSQFDVGLLRPRTPIAMSCIISSAPYIIDSLIWITPDLATKDFTADIPVSDAVGVLIEIDPTTNTLHYTTGTSFDASLSLRQAFTDYLPKTITEGRFCIGYVKLYVGIDSVGITRNEILNAQELLGKSAGTGGADIDTIVTWEGQVVTYNGNVVTYDEG